MAGKLKPPSKEVTLILEREREMRGRGSALPVLVSFFFTLPRVSDTPEPTWNQVAMPVTPAEMFSPFYRLSWVNLFTIF